MSKIFERYSYEQYLQRALSGEPSPYPQSFRSSREIDSFRTDWTGTESFDAAKRLALEGWPLGRELVGQILTEVESEMESETQVMGWDVTGDFVDVGAFVSGQPENMMRWEPVPERKRVARILLNMSVSSGVSTKVIRWRGATVMALIDRLEQSGVRIELDMAYACTNHGRSSAVFIANLKRAEEPLHLDLLSFHLTHPSSFRRIFFSFVEQCPKSVIDAFGFKFNGSYGIPEKVNDLIPESEHYDLIIPEMNLCTVEASIAEIEKMFNIINDVKELYHNE